ncbi:M24 family metallopeptidase [Halovivax gelatinilyticus]|uniref:M24 family metallopeptidase n=1 Tax=Halovivax gelatinilyticus TaxID=2961597 RepID=UPI0020CA86E7|nr:Xaa-Pro peptidase family protein [Halovivax gelatinilyticus]
MQYQPTDDRRERTERAQKLLRERDADALILSKGIDQYYLSGFLTREQKRHLFLIVPAEGEPAYFAPDPYRRQLENQSWVPTMHIWEDSDDPIEKLREAVAEIGIADAETVLVNEEMWGMYVIDLVSVLDAEFSTSTDLMLSLRRRKSESEIDKMREAADITDTVSEEVRSLDVVGMTENELAAEIEYRVRKYGAGDRGSTQVASGPNGSHPPHAYSNRTIEDGDPVIIDFGCSVDGYLSDQSRVLVAGGDPPAGFVDAFETVREAQEAAIEMIEPGVVAADVDATARSIIEEAGYEGQFLHVTGHGLGLGIHEPPYLMSGSYMDGGNRLELEEGMVLTVEPAIYEPEEWGIRVEDIVLVTDDGSERLNGSDHGWEPL